MVTRTCLKQDNVFQYFGALITEDEIRIKEIKYAIVQAKVAFQKLKHILCNIALSIEMRNGVFRSYIKPISYPHPQQRRDCTIEILATGHHTMGFVTKATGLVTVVTQGSFFKFRRRDIRRLTSHRHVTLADQDWDHDVFFRYCLMYLDRLQEH